MASNFTENFSLCQWEATDQVLRTEFNEDNQKIDQALKTMSTKETELEEALAQKGNCKMVVTTYQGTGRNGEDNPTTLAFTQGEPDLILIMDFYGHTMMLYRGCSATVSSSSTVFVNWSSNQVSWYSNVSASAQMNSIGTHHVFCFYAM